MACGALDRGAAEARRSYNVDNRTLVASSPFAFLNLFRVPSFLPSRRAKASVLRHSFTLAPVSPLSRFQIEACISLSFARHVRNSYLSGTAQEYLEGPIHIIAT